MLVCFGLMTVLWLVQLRTRNAAVVDVGWTLCFAWLHLREVHTWRGLGLGLLVGLWALRLGGHLFTDRIWKGPEEGRYVKLRQEWGAKAPLYFLIFFYLQAVSDWVLAAPYGCVYRNPDPTLGRWELLGTLVFLVGWTGVGLADRQLARFKADPANKGQVCQAGLWNYSRHPNYFFEVVTWTGWSLYALGSPGGAWSFLSPALLLYTILRVTGIPPTEEQALKSRGEAYRRYQQTTSAFVPWFKKG